MSRDYDHPDPPHPTFFTAWVISSLAWLMLVVRMNHSPLKTLIYATGLGLFTSFFSWVFLSVALGSPSDTKAMRRIEFIAILAVSLVAIATSIPHLAKNQLASRDFLVNSCLIGTHDVRYEVDVNYRVSICNNGAVSTSAGRGTCSWNKGVSHSELRAGKETRSETRKNTVALCQAQAKSVSWLF